jgi:peptidoglycan/xylan/chitin deacetylase (PgdA/CDA1 family)
VKIILTHDADSICKPFKHIWRNRSRFSAEDIGLAAQGTKNLYNNLQDIVALEEKHGFHSTFFIPVFLFNIDEIIDTLKSIKNSGWEVQLHYVHGLIQPEGLFEMQKEFFKHKLELGSLEGVRVHNLNVGNETLEMFRKGGLLYDSSYRKETVGTSDLYRVKGGLVEIPIGIMDTDVFGRLSLGSNEEAAWEYILSRIREAREKKAEHFCILFHQESYRMKGGRLYKDLMKHLRSEGYDVERCIDAVRKDLAVGERKNPS